MGVDPFEYRGEHGYVLTVAGSDNMWTWAYRVPQRHLHVTGDEKFGSELAAFADGMSNAHDAVDRILDRHRLP